MTPADPCPHVPVHLFCSCTLLRGGPHLLRSVGDRGWGGGPWSQARHFVAPSRAETPRLACGSRRILRWGEEGNSQVGGGGDGGCVWGAGTRRVTHGGVGDTHTHPPHDAQNCALAGGLLLSALSSGKAQSPSRESRLSQQRGAQGAPTSLLTWFHWWGGAGSGHGQTGNQILQMADLLRKVNPPGPVLGIYTVWGAKP